MAPAKTLPQQFGRYRIVKQVGEGGMGTVYLAEDTFLTRKIALKVPHFGNENQDLINRFYREARVAAKIDHPNICSVFDVGQIDGIHYLTMPYIEGTPLNKIGRGKPWPPPRAVKLIRQIAVALGFLHSQGIMHRDLKPGNIMIRSDGEPVLMDFGLARAFNNDEQRMTSTGAAMGTPAYMSPEQVSGDINMHGPGIDIYALGVILYELLSGQLPFVGSLAVVYGQILAAQPQPPSTLAPGIPPALDAVCLKAMGKKPEQRFATMEDFARELDTYMRTGGSSVKMAALPPEVPSGASDPTEPQMIGTTQPNPSTSPQRMVCPGCGQKLKLPPGMTAPRLRCPRCATVVTAPRTTGPERSALNPQGRPMSPPSRRSSRWPWIIVVLSLLATLGFILYLLLSHLWADDPNQVPKNLPTEMENSIGMKMRLIPEGKFTMGSPTSEAGRDPKEPLTEQQHSVEITRPYYLGAYEVTQAQYEKVMGVNPSRYKAKDGEYPVENVTYERALEFCRRLSEIPEEKKQKRVYRLPTEAEWEYACRGGEEGQPFNTGAKLRHDEANFDSSDLGGSYLGHSTSVGKFNKPNKFGLYDMHGNVWEWCSDWYGKDYYQTSPLRNPLGPEKGENDMRVMRGGSWRNPTRDCRSAARHRADTITEQDNRGFRVLMEPHKSPP